MGASTLGSRAIIGEFFNRLNQDLGASWISDVSMYFESNQESETYNWLGMAPAMREWIGGRNAKGFRENGVTIRNKTFEATLDVLTDEIRRDKTGQVMLRVAELAQRANSHWASLLTTLIVAGASANGYDGTTFFADAHSEGASGSQDNNLTSAAATATQPTAAEAEAAIMGAVAAILNFKDDQGEPMNENAKFFMVMVPVPFWKSAIAAVGAPSLAQGATNIITSADGFGFKVQVNPRLTWTEKLAIFRTDGNIKPFIRQEEVPVEVSAIAEGSELEFNERVHRYGLYASGNVGYGYWQQSCLVTLA